MVQNDNRFTMPDGRRLGYAVYGSPSGRPVLFFHGIPGSRLQHHPDLSLVERNRLQIFAPERPGIGLSDEVPYRTLLSWAQDIQVFCNHQGWDRIAVIGVSGGGPYALACAHYMPERITHVVLVSSMGPLKEQALRSSLSAGARALFRSAVTMPHLTRFFAHMAYKFTSGRLEKLFRYSGIPLPARDRRLLAKKEIAVMLMQDVAEAFRTQGRGVVQELKIQSQPWGFELAGVRATVNIWHGTADSLVPPVMAQYLAENLPSARLHWIQDGGHFIALEIMEEVFPLLG